MDENDEYQKLKNMNIHEVKEICNQSISRPKTTVLRVANGVIYTFYSYHGEYPSKCESMSSVFVPF